MDILTQQPPRGEPGGAPGGTNTATVVGAGRDTLLEFVAREMIRHKQEAIRILGDMRASEAVSAIIASGLRSEHGDLRATAAYSLGQIGDRKAVEPLLESLRDFYAVASLDTSGVIAAGNPRFSHTVRHDFEAAIRARLNAVWALGRLGDAAAKPLLSQAQNDFNSLVRDAATEALAEIEKRAPLFADNRP
jgi:hypothetical protein